MHSSRRRREKDSRTEAVQEICPYGVPLASGLRYTLEKCQTNVDKHLIEEPEG